MNVRLYSVVLCLVCGAALATSAPWVMLSAKTATIAVHGGVATVPATGLIAMPANYFDLEGTTVTFTPDGTGRYSVEVGDLFSTGGGTGPVNAPVQGIGEWQADPTPGEYYGSESLLTSMMPVFIGAQNWTETGVADSRVFRAFGPGIRWIAHEAIHRWSSHLRFRNPVSGKIED